MRNQSIAPVSGGARVRLKVLTGGVGALALLLAPQWAQAQGDIHTSTIFKGQSDYLDVVLTGELPSRCLLEGGGDYDLGELRGGLAVQFGFGLVCNVPFSIRIESARGGLAHVTHSQGQGPYSGLLEYDLELEIPTLKPQRSQMRGAFHSRDLIGAKSLSSGNSIAAGGGTISLMTRHPAGAGLLAGNYAETLSLTVEPDL